MWNRSILVSLTLFLALPLWAADSPPGTVSVLTNFKDSVGLVDYFKPQDIPDTAARSLRNVDFSLNGALTQRRGVSRNFFNLSIGIVADASFPIQPHFLDIYVSTVNNKTYFFSRLLSRTQIHDYPVTLANDIALSGCGNTSGAQLDGIAFPPTNSYYFVADTRSGCKLVNNISTDATVNVFSSTTIPPAKYLQVHLNRLLVAGSTNPLRIYYSAEDDADDFPLLNTIDIFSSGKGDEIRGIGPPLLGLLPIYTRDTTQILSGTAYPDGGGTGNVSVRMINDTIGCVHHRTIRNMNNRQYFFSSGENGGVPGIYSLNGVSVKEETKQIRNLFLNNVDVSTRILPNAFVYKENYCLDVATKNSGIVNLMICLDKNGRVTVNDSSLDQTSPLSLGYGVAYKGSIIFVNGAVSANTNSNGVFLKWDDGFKDDHSSTSVSGGAAQPIPFKYKSKDFDFGKPATPKLFDRAYISYDNALSSFTLKLNFDFNVAASSWVIYSTTNYQNNSAIQTVTYSSTTMTSKLTLPQTKFKYVNFEISSSSYASVNFVDLRAQALPLE